MKTGAKHSWGPMGSMKLFLVISICLYLGPQSGGWPAPLSLSEAEERTPEEEGLNRSVASALNALGVFLYDSGRLDEAEAQFREGLRYSADDKGIRANLAMVFFRQSRFREILDLYPQSGAGEVSDSALLTALAVSHYAVGEYEKAIPYFEGLSVQGSTKPELEIMLAVALDLTGAEAQSQKVLARLGASPELEAGYHVFKGDALRDRGRIQEAIVEYEQALTIHTSLPTVPYRLGVLYSDTHQYEEALQAFQKELVINPTSADAAYSIGAYYLIWGQDFEKAREFFQRAVASDSANIGGYLGLMKVHLAKDDPEGALRVAQQAETLGLEYPDLYYLKARALRLTGKEELAEKALRRFEELKSRGKEREESANP